MKPTTIELSTGRRFDVVEPIEEIEAWIGGAARLLKLHVVRNGHVKRLSLHTGVLISAESAREPLPPLPPPPLSRLDPAMRGLPAVQRMPAVRGMRSGAGRSM